MTGCLVAGRWNAVLHKLQPNLTAILIVRRSKSNMNSIGTEWSAFVALRCDVCSRGEVSAAGEVWCTRCFSCYFAAVGIASTCMLPINAIFQYSDMLCADETPSARVKEAVVACGVLNSSARF